MFQSFRHAMTWLHTWFGLVLGYVLMVCFFFGALSVFDREIDRWALPDTRFAAQPAPSFDTVLKPLFERLRPHPDDIRETRERVIGALPDPDSLPMETLYYYRTHRDPVLRIGADFSIPNKLKNLTDEHPHAHGWATIDPRTGATLPESRFKIGSDFIYPMHYGLNLRWQDLGRWIVGLAALAMLAALVSGVVMHRRIFREFFTFRPWKTIQRGTLDLHNLTGVAGLPFHFFFALTGLIIFASVYFPIGHTLLKPLHERHEVMEAVRTGLAHEPAGVPAPLAPVDAMVLEAKRRWAARDMPGEVGFLVIRHVGDRNSHVSIFRAGNDQVALVGQGVHFEASSGRVIREDPPPSAVMSVNEFLTGLHLQHFRHWLLRWLYVVGGLLGCVCIATGFIFFVEKRKAQHAKTGSSGSRIVDALAVFAITGMAIAAAAMLVANRVLPADMADKGDWEKCVFWAAWLLGFIHAALRSGPVAQARINPAWREQCWTLAALAFAAVLLNWATTGDHLVKTVLLETYWPVAGLDLSLLATAATALFAGRVLARRERAARPAAAKSEAVTEASHA